MNHLSIESQDELNGLELPDTSANDYRCYFFVKYYILFVRNGMIVLNESLTCRLFALFRKRKSSHISSRALVIV